MDALRTLCLTILCHPALAQPQGDPTLPPSGLTIATVHVGQGDATVLVGPTGIAMVYDAGPENAGTLRVLPMLATLGVRTIRYAVCSHYDTDHIGGMDEVLNAIPVVEAWDRGLTNAPTHNAYTRYAGASLGKRRQVTVGSAFDLGGGARAVVLAANGFVNGTQYPVAGTNQEENARSIVLRIEYGDFSMWLGGDLTGGGNRTYDMETKVAAACGDVDVYHVDHHGSNTSSNATLLSLLRPEVSLASAGRRNPFGHPTTGVINRINPRSGSSLFLCTTEGANSNLGHGVAGSHILTTDGYRYRITGAGGEVFDVYTDEVASRILNPGALRISELHRRPSRADGEYLEIYCSGPGPVNLRGLQIQGNQGSVTIRTPYRLLPGDRMLFCMQGDPTANGGLPLGHCLPFQGISFGDVFDTLVLRLGGAVMDSLSYANLAGGSGIAAERVDVFGPSTPANFAAATTLYGADRGTPGLPNAGDTSSYLPVATMEVLPATAPGGRAIHMIAAAPTFPLSQHAMAMALTNNGFTIQGTFIPLDVDLLFEATLLLPGVIAPLRADGRRGLRVPVPTVSGLQGLRAHFAHVLLDPNGPRPFPAASGSVPFVFP